jgi:hypothetical protein
MQLLYTEAFFGMSNAALLECSLLQLTGSSAFQGRLQAS